VLIHLNIRNLAVIETMQLTFRQGFQVLTGETGAGKSMIIDALTLIAGGRGSAEWVRHGCEKAEIEAMFEVASDHPVWSLLTHLGILASCEENLVIRREINDQGKSSSRINGQLINLSMLREIAEWLINIHGQHEHQSLLKSEEHLKWLDAFGGQDVAELKQSYQLSYDKYLSLSKQIRDLMETSKQALQMLDLYRFQAEEISAAQLKLHEDELLLEEKRKLSHAEKLMQNITEAYESIYGGKGGLNPISSAMRKIQEIESFDAPVLKPFAEQIQSAFYMLEDAAFQLRDYREQIEFSPSKIDVIEQRLDLIASLRRKYGNNVAEILQYLHKITEDLSQIENKDEILRKLQAEADVEKTKTVQLALLLSDRRDTCAKELSVKIERELHDLQMGQAKFTVQMNRLEDAKGIEVTGEKIKLTPHGCDAVEFLISANPGEPLRPLSKIASGGELSRVMLALKSIFAKLDRIPVLIFDEVDTGVSGRAAQAIAEKLSFLSNECQVFSITHLPQIACMADAHFLIVKAIEEKRTFTQVMDLDEQGRIVELARMLGGVEVTVKTLDHAREMLRLAERKKQHIRHVFV